MSGLSKLVKYTEAKAIIADVLEIEAKIIAGIKRLINKTGSDKI